MNGNLKQLIDDYAKKNYGHTNWITQGRAFDMNIFTYIDDEHYTWNENLGELNCGIFFYHREDGTPIEEENV